MARTIHEQTGWERPHPETICQDIGALEQVTEYDYDMQNADFVKYVKRRTGYCLNVGDVIAETARDDEPKYVKLTRAKLQDCWELFTAKR